MDRLHRRCSDRDEFEANLLAAGFENVEIEETHRVHDQAWSAIVRATMPS